MAEVVEIIPQPGGGRVIVFDDGSRVTELPPVHIVGDPGPGPEDRSIGDRLILADDPGALGRRPIHTDSPEDMAWLRFEIEHGNTFRESAPIRVDARDEFLGIGEHEGWYYTVGRRTGITVAQRVTGHLGPSTPLLGGETYIWGVRGSEAARAAWTRDFARSGRFPAVLSPEARDSLADRGLPPDGPIVSRSTHEFSWSDIPAAILLISQAALQAQPDFRRDVDRFVARYNGTPYSSIVAVIAGVVEWGFRLLTEIIGLPAAIVELLQSVGEVFNSIRESIPDVVTGLEEAPLETAAMLAETVYNATLEITTLGDIGREFSTAIELGRQRRDAESSLHVVRALTRIIELILIVRTLAMALRRIPAVVGRMRRSITRLAEVTREMRAARTALREGRPIAGALEEGAEGAGGARRGRAGDADAPEAPAEGSRSGDGEGGERSEGGERPAEGHGDGPEADGERPRTLDEDVDRAVDSADAAIAEDAPYGPRESTSPEGAGRVPLRRGAEGPPTALGAELRALERVRTSLLTAEQLRAARRVVGQRLNSTLQQAWRSVINPLDRRDLTEIRRLMARADDATLSAGVRAAARRGAYEIAREYLYPRVAGRFWNHVRTTPRLARIFEDAGLTLRPGRVPAWILPDGTEVRLSLEHLRRVSDNPLRCIDAANFSVVPLEENTHLLEIVRAVERFAEFAAAGH